MVIINNLSVIELLPLDQKYHISNLNEMIPTILIIRTLDQDLIDFFTNREDNNNWKQLHLDVIDTLSITHTFVFKYSISFYLKNVYIPDLGSVNIYFWRMCGNDYINPRSFFELVNKNLQSLCGEGIIWKTPESYNSCLYKYGKYINEYLSAEKVEMELKNIYTSEGNPFTSYSRVPKKTPLYIKHVFESRRSFNTYSDNNTTCIKRFCNEIKDKLTMIQIDISPEIVPQTNKTDWEINAEYIKTRNEFFCYTLNKKRNIWSFATTFSKNEDPFVSFIEHLITTINLYYSNVDGFKKQDDRFQNSQFTFDDYIAEIFYTYMFPVKDKFYYSDKSDEESILDYFIIKHRDNQFMKTHLENIDVRVIEPKKKMNKKKKKINDEIEIETSNNSKKNDIIKTVTLWDIISKKPRKISYNNVICSHKYLFTEITILDNVNLFSPPALFPLMENEINRYHEIINSYKTNIIDLEKFKDLQYEFFESRYYIESFKKNVMKLSINTNNLDYIYNKNILNMAINIIHSHFYYVLSGGFDDRYTLLLNYFLHPLVNPGFKTGLMIWLFGGGGAGKSVALEEIKECIFKDSMLFIDCFKHAMSSQFNLNQLNRSYIVFEEASIPYGDNVTLSKLKSKITGRNATFEGKGIESQSGENIANYIATTNDNRFISFSEGDNSTWRRMTILKVNNEFAFHKAFNVLYFQRLRRSLCLFLPFYFDYAMALYYNENYDFNSQIESTINEKNQRISYTSMKTLAINYWMSKINAKKNNIESTDEYEYHQDNNINNIIDYEKLKNNLRLLNGNGGVINLKINTDNNNNYLICENWLMNTLFSSNTVKDFKKYIDTIKNNKSNDIDKESNDDFIKMEMIRALEEVFTDFNGETHIKIDAHDFSKCFITWPTPIFTYLLLDQKFSSRSRIALNSMGSFFGVIYIKNIILIQTLARDKKSSLYHISNKHTEVNIQVLTTSILRIWFDDYMKLQRLHSENDGFFNATNIPHAESLPILFFLIFLNRSIPLVINIKQDEKTDPVKNYMFLLEYYKILKHKIYDFIYLFADNDIEREKIYSNEMIELDEFIGNHLITTNLKDIFDNSDFKIYEDMNKRKSNENMEVRKKLYN